jgi:hypothetical protein
MGIACAGYEPGCRCPQHRCHAAFGLGSGERRGAEHGMTQKYDERITLAITTHMHEYLQLMADRQKCSLSDVVRQAVRDYLDAQEDIIGSRSRLGNRVARQLLEIQDGLLKRQNRADTLLLAAIILLQMKQGIEGSKILSQVSQLAAHAGDEIRAVLEAEA